MAQSTLKGRKEEGKDDKPYSSKQCDAHRFIPGIAQQKLYRKGMFVLDNKTLSAPP